ncbi:MAG: dienelactone hydrolase family protein [Betaproteobacteria bacterium]
MALLLEGWCQRLVAQGCAFWFGAVAAPATLAAPIEIPATEVTLTAHWLPAAGSGPRPTIVALHGCGGMYARDGKTLSQRMTDYAQRFNAAGWNVLIPDSLGARGLRSICTQRYSERSLTVEVRRTDVQAALAWLTARPEVDAQRIAVVCCSNGGSTALLAADTSAGALPLRATVAFYPGCREAQSNRNYALAAPLLMLLGAADDWTPPARCLQLAERLRARGAPVEVQAYPGAYHGFDGTDPVRLRTDVPNGVSKNGVHIGGDPAARAAALQALDEFLRKNLE